MLTNLDILLKRLMDPEYLYLLLEPLPLFGLLFGLIFFAVGIYLGQDKCRIAALIALTLACFSVIPYSSYRKSAMQRIQSSMVSTTRVKAQMELRDDSKWIYYAVGIAALVALISGGKLGVLGNYAVLGLGIVAFIFSVWLHMKEAEVYHPNLGTTPTKVGAGAGKGKAR